MRFNPFKRGRPVTVKSMCPHCSKGYDFEEKEVGRRVFCKGCGQQFVVENLSGPQQSPAGVKILRHEVKAGAGKLTASATPYLEQIQKHIERTIGPSPQVFHEIVSTDVHVDLHVVPAQPDLPVSKSRPLGGDYVTIVTSGMSTRPMNLPPGAKDGGISEYAELMLALPKNWPGLLPNGMFDQEKMKDEANWWPIRWLKQMARLPHVYDTFLSNGATVPNGDPATPFQTESELCCWMAFKPLLCLDARQLIISDDVRVDFFALFALTEREMNLKLQKGIQPLLTSLADAEVYTELLDVRRKSVV